MSIRNKCRADKEEKKSFQHVILLGDSIRMGYQDVVAKALDGKVDLFFPEENCQDTPFMLKNLEKWLAGKNPDLVHINCGLHDIFLDDGIHTRRSIEAYSLNLYKILEEIHRLCPDAVIIFALTTPVDEEKQPKSQTYGRLVRRNSDVDAINAAARSQAEKLGITVNDLHELVCARGIREMLIDDGIHLNEHAAEILGKQVTTTIKKALNVKG